MQTLKDLRTKIHHSETTLEERRHHADMAIVFKILTENKEEVDPTIWFGKATGVTRVTRIAADRR